MYCRKCGKQIDDGSKFCPYCGSDVKEAPADEWGNEPLEDALTETGQEKRISKKWIIPVGVVVGIAVVTSVGVLAMNLSKSEPTDNQVVTEQKATPKKQDKPESVKEPESNSEISTSNGGTEKTVEEAAHPKEITLDADVRDKLTRFIYLLAEVDYRGDKKGITTLSKAELGDIFLYYSMHGEGEFITGRDDLSALGHWELTKGEVDTYLKNSIGSTEYEHNYNMPNSGDLVRVWMGDPPAVLQIESIQILKVTPISENDIKLEGSMMYTNLEKQTEKPINIQLTLTANPDSIWGGYTLKEINSWGDGTATTGDYVLQDIATRYYSENELSSMDAHMLYLARNELYARHGYIFNNADLKEYFGAESWYEATTTNVPDSKFNLYEKANLDLIIAVEEKKK